MSQSDHSSEIPQGWVPYVVDIEVRAWDYPPPYSNRAAPEMSRVAEAATRAARRVVEDTGLIIEGTGHGSSEVICHDRPSGP